MAEHQPLLDGFEPDPPPAAGESAGGGSGSKRRRGQPKVQAKPPGVEAAPEPQASLQENAPAAESSSTPAVAIDPWPPSCQAPAPGVLPDLRGQTVVVIDSHSLIYQLFHAMGPMSSPSGFPISTVHGFLRDLADLRQRLQPTYMWCAYDVSEKTFRSDLYEKYKAHRESMPDELRIQIPVIHQGVQALGIGLIGVPGFEADDLLATIAAKVSSAGGECILVTSDKDCRQLLSEHVVLYNIRKDERFSANELQAIWGIRPDQVVDFQALVGDATDNIPGVPLIGPKFAQQLLQQYGTLDDVLTHADEVSGKKRAENLRVYREQALLSRELSRLRHDVPLDLDWGSANFSRKNEVALSQMFKEYGLRRLAERLMSHQAVPATTAPNWHSDYTCVTTPEQLTRLVQDLSGATVIAIDTETTSTHARDADLVGLSVAWGEGQAAYIPVRAPDTARLLSWPMIAEALKPAFSSPHLAKVGQNLKFDLVVLRSHGVEVQGLLCDTMVADYLVDPGQRNHSLDELAKRRLQHEMTPISQLIGSGRNQRCMDQVDLPLITQYACEDVDVPWRLTPPMLEQLQSLNLHDLFQQVEMPLVEVLAEMEYNGICVDPEKLRLMSVRFESRIEQLRAEIVGLAGESFNLDSPKQLSVILFQKLGLPVIKRTATGPSTDVEVLQELSNHEIAAKLIEYRQLTKLKGTYIDTLPNLISPKTGRIHTSFRQDVAATGRLSSSDPNLQNIPIRTEDGRQIRSAFSAGPKDWVLMAADYSQIELRVLAHYCRDANLCRAFAEDRDIHAQVAAQVYNVPIDQVSSAQRRSAKAINFGILYGQSPYGLAKSLKISSEEAASFIDAYFAGLPGVRDFIAHTLTQCRQQGWVSTLFGRRRQVQGVRDFNELSESKRRVLIEPERIAINTVIQGTAADLIKVAMIRVAQQLKAGTLQAKLLLQIHDELVFEVAQPDVPALTELVRHEMSNAAQLDVPLKVDIKTGRTWDQCE